MFLSYLVASAPVRSEAVVLLSFIHCLFVVAHIDCGILVLGHCLVLQYVMSFLVLQSSRWDRKSWLLYVRCVLKGMWLLSPFDSSSRCHGVGL